jgi:AcrR family transcriptional regulator
MPRGVADKRTAILTAARRLFGGGHYHSTTIPALAREAGVAEGTIYNYFSSKEDVGYTALAEASDLIEQDLRAAVPQQAPPLEQLSFAAALLLQVAEEDLETGRFVLCVDHRSYLGNRAEEAFGLAREVAAIVADASDRQETKDAPIELLVGVWLGVVRAAIAARTSGRLTGPLTDLADTVGAAAVDAIRR